MKAGKVRKVRKRPETFFCVVLPPELLNDAESAPKTEIFIRKHKTELTADWSLNVLTFSIRCTAHNSLEA